MPDIHQFDYNSYWTCSMEINNNKKTMGVKRNFDWIYKFHWTNTKKSAVNKVWSVSGKDYSSSTSDSVWHTRSLSERKKKNISRYSRKSAMMMNCFPIWKSMIKTSTKTQLFYIPNGNVGLFSLSSMKFINMFWGLVYSIAFILNNSCKHIHDCVGWVAWIYVLFGI